MSVAEYVKSQLGNQTYDNVVFAFHGGEEGQANSQVLTTFGPKSDVNGVLKGAVSGNGSIVYDSCYGIAGANGAQDMANIYGMNVLNSSLGPVYQSAVDLKPSLPVNPSNPNTGYRTDWGFWVVTKPNTGGGGDG